MVNLDQAIEAFWRSASRGVYYPPDWFGKLSIDEAFRIQLGLLDKKLNRGERLSGWKVGLTAKAIQEQFDVHEPLCGYLLHSGMISSGGQLTAAELINPGFENEICMRLKAPLRGPGVDVKAARACVGELFPAIELVENRGDFSAQLAVSVADNIQQCGFILGEPIDLMPDFDLNSIRVRIRMNGKEIAVGTADSVLGNPLNSLVWLANKLDEYDRGLDAGQYVMSGSLTRQFPLILGDSVLAEFEGLGAVSLEMV